MAQKKKAKVKVIKVANGGIREGAGRKPLPDGERRGVPYKVMFRESEAEELDRRAAAADMPVPSYIRLAVFPGAK